jgi:competence protein ComFC
MNILDLIFPKRCVNCGKLGKYFCDRCRSTIRPILSNEPICPMCERPAIDGVTHPGCRTRYSIDGLVSFFHYDGAVRKAVKAIKYRNITDLVSEFVSLVPMQSYLVLSKLLITNPQSILIPIPLHVSRLRERGFNQAEVLGALLAKHMGIELHNDVLVRTKKTAPQVSMKKRKDRLKNMEGVFAIAPHHSLSHLISVILFDDVFTTGATMRSAANVLKRAGVKTVWAVTMAR